MIHCRHNRILLFCLVTAFLAVQWFPAHIHLAGYHDHGDDGPHHHGVQAHVHAQALHHGDSIDVANDGGHLSVVVLDQQCSSPGGKKQGGQTLAPLPFWLSVTYIFPVGARLPEVVNTRQFYLDRSTVRLRAPPYVS